MVCVESLGEERNPTVWLGGCISWEYAGVFVGWRWRDLTFEKIMFSCLYWALSQEDGMGSWLMEDDGGL